MIGLIAKQVGKKWLVRRFVAPTFGFHGDEYGVKRRQLAWIVNRSPAPVGFVITYIGCTDSLAKQASPEAFALSPDMERAGVPRLLVAYPIKR